LEAIDWMLGHSTPEEVDEEQRDWGDLGLDVRDGMLSIPDQLVADFVEDLEDGAEQIVAMAEGLDDDDRRDSRAMAKALRTIAAKFSAAVI
jgi:hypothetical protein